MPQWSSTGAVSPTFFEVGHPVFLTWRLFDKLPTHRFFPTASLISGQAFGAMDKLLDETHTGSFYPRQPEIAGIVVEAIRYNATVLRHFDVHAFVVMPNHVHLLVTPHVLLPNLTKSLKNITARRANAMLGLTGHFWQEESYDHLVRKGGEFEKIRHYIEENPVRAGLVRQANDFRWSSAEADEGAADRGVRPTVPLQHSSCQDEKGETSKAPESPK